MTNKPTPASQQSPAQREEANRAKMRERHAAIGAPHEVLQPSPARSDKEAELIFQARSPEGDPWQEVSADDFIKASANGYETRLHLARPGQNSVFYEVAGQAQERAPSGESIGDDLHFCDLMTELSDAHAQVGGDASKKAWAALVKYIHEWFARSATAGTTAAPSDNWHEVINVIADELQASANMTVISQFTALCEEFDKRATAGNAAPTVPDGYKAMPPKPTLGMIAAGKREYQTAAATIPSIYVAMFNAAPELASPAATAAPGELPKWIDNLKGSDPTMDDVIAFTEQALASNAGAAPGWIDTDERLPEDGQDVIILYWPYDNRENERVAGSAHHVAGTFYDEDGNDMHLPSHWMPLNIPAAPSDTSPVGATQDKQEKEL